MGDQSVGPLKAADIYSQLSQGKVTYLQYVWKPGMAAWARLADVPAFQVAAPQAPVTPPKPPTPPAPPVAVQKKEWFLFYQEQQTGPYTLDEARGVIGVHQLDATSSFAWKEGLAGWSSLGDLQEFSSVATTSASAQPQEKRSAVRKPIIAKVLLAEGGQVFFGIGRDISVGGMQVLSGQLPKKVGSTLKLNISPTTETSPQFQPFVAEGVVVRIFEDGRGFSFRFGVLDESSRATIESLISQLN